MKLAEILTGPETWCQGTREHDGRLCLVGALSQLAHGEPRGWVSLIDPEYQRMLLIICAVQPNETSVTFWNDAPIRTWDEVATVVDAYDRDRLLNP